MRNPPLRLSLVALAFAFLGLAGPAAAALFTFGSTDSTVSTLIDTLGLNFKGVNVMTSPKAGTLTKVEGYMDGRGAGSGSEKVRVVVYNLDASNNPTTLRGVSSELTITAGATAGWKTFTFPSAVTVPAGKVGIGYWSGGSTANLARPYYDTSSSSCSLKWNTNTYSSTGNPASPFSQPINCGSKNRPWTIRVTADDGPAPSVPPLRDRVGVNVPNVATDGVPLTYGQTVLAQDGIHLFRDSLTQSNTFPSSPTPNWTYVDRTVTFIKNVSGGRFLPVIWTSPSWQHPGCSGYQCPPDSGHLQEWSNEAVKMIDHVVAAGVAVPEIEIWNEPWYGTFWRPSPNASYYVQLAKNLATTVWAKYPNMKVLLAADYWALTPCCSTQWFSAVLAADTTGFINDPRVILTTHNYPRTDGPTVNRGLGWSFNRYLDSRALAVNHGKTSPHFEITEYGWCAAAIAGQPDTHCVDGAVSEQTQSDYTTQGAHLALTDTCACVDRVFVYEDSAGTSAGTLTSGYNVRRNNGTRRPVGAALKAYIAAGIP